MCMLHLQAQTACAFRCTMWLQCIGHQRILGPSVTSRHIGALQAQLKLLLAHIIWTPSGWCRRQQQSPDMHTISVACLQTAGSNPPRRLPFAKLRGPDGRLFRSSAQAIPEQGAQALQFPVHLGTLRLPVIMESTSKAQNLVCDWCLVWHATVQSPCLHCEATNVLPFAT